MYISEDAIQNKRDTDGVNIWYDRGPLCSYNGLFNFALGARGTGKTFNYKCWAMKSDKPFITHTPIKAAIPSIKNKKTNKSNINFIFFTSTIFIPYFFQIIHIFFS